MKKINTIWQRTKALMGIVSMLMLSQTVTQAQCLTGTQYPSNTITPVCNGVTFTQIAPNNYAGEYAVVTVTSGETYQFTSSIATDYITISTNGGTSAAAHGVQPLTWVATTTGDVRVYFHTNAACGTQNTNRATAVKCGVPPSCLPPAPTTTTAITHNTATLNWTAPATAPANGYEYYYSTTNTAPTASTTPSGSVGAGVLTANIGSLTQGTTYYAWVRAVCSSSDKSPWMAASSFTTEYLSPAPWTEGFSGSNTPAGFTFPTYWYSGTTTGINGNPGNALIANLYSFATTANFSTLNVGPLPAGSFLQFDYKNADYNATTAPPAGAGYIKIYVSTNYGSTYTQIDSFSTLTTTAWTPKSLSLSAYTGQNVKIRVIGTWVSGDYNIAFDNLFIGVPPTCATPGVTSNSNITLNSASINWTAPVNAPANGYEYYYNTAPTNPTASTTPSGSVGAGVLTAPLSSLAANTWYYFWVRSICSSSDKSAWTARDSFFTGTCVPNGLTTSTSYYVSSMTTAGAIGNINYTATSGIPYVNNTATILQTYAGNSFSCYMEASAGTNYFYIWVDWNNDLDFSDPGETILATTTYTSNVTHTMNIPAGTTAGNYRMRVANSWSGNITACGPADYGNYIDFTLQVAAPPSCAAPTAVANTATTNVSGTITWTAPATAPANGYEYYHSTSNTAPANTATATGSVGAGVTTATIPSLAPNTTYYVWVRSVCGSSDKSNWSTAATFTTQVLVPTNWLEEFNTTATPAGFNISGWTIGTAGSFGTSPANYLYKNQYSSATAYGEFSTLNVGAIAATDILKFRYRAAHYYSPYPAPLAGAGYFKVFISTNFGTSYTQLDSLPLPAVNGWDSLTYPLNAYVGQNVKVKIQSYWSSTVADDYNIAFDNFFIGTPPCTPPTVNIGADTSICSGTTLTLNAGNATGLTYSWNTGATTSSINVTTAGTYSVSVSNGTCAASDTIIVGLTQTPIVNLGPDTTVCTATSYTLDAGAGPNYTYLWNTGNIQQQIDVTTDGQYHVTVTNGTCVASDTVNVNFSTMPAVNGITATGNPSPTFNFEANGASNAATYTWDFGHNGATASGATATYTYPSLATAATYTVTLTVTNECGSASVTTVVTVNPVSVKELQLDEKALKLFPNPGSHTVKLINESNFKMKQIVLTNILGQTVANIPVHNNTQSINLSKLPSGLYHVRIEFEEGTVIRKLEVIK
ncbi:MAG: fibronectin type III domain-containing protein [Taibaiella sp.]|nr:fibronectin type III domain-containing protein [Taibaiella sp.]